MVSSTASSDFHWNNGEGMYCSDDHEPLCDAALSAYSNLFFLYSCVFDRFLAGWPGLAFNESHETWLRRILFGVNFIVKLPPQVSLDMAASILQYSLTTTQLLQSVTPFFGEPSSYEYDRNMDRIGDVAAKTEARKMILESVVVPEVPVMFDDESPSKSGKTEATLEEIARPQNGISVVPSSDATEEKVSA